MEIIQCDFVLGFCVGFLSRNILLHHLALYYMDMSALDITLLVDIGLLGIYGCEHSGAYFWEYVYIFQLGIHLGMEVLGIQVMYVFSCSIYFHL